MSQPFAVLPIVIKLGSICDLDNEVFCLGDLAKTYQLSTSRLGFSRSTITVDEAKALLFHERVLSLRDGGPDLGSVSQLSEDCAEVLATYRGPLQLNRLREITPGVAQALSRHQGPLYLLQVSQIRHAVAEALLQHQGAVVTFPLAEMSSGAQSLLNEHRRKICEEQGLPSRSQFAASVGTFQPGPSTANLPGEFLYYVNANTPDPIPIIVDRKTAEPTPWLADFLPKIGECIEHVYADGLLGSNPCPNTYLLSVNVSLVSGGAGVTRSRSIPSTHLVCFGTLVPVGNVSRGSSMWTAGAAIITGTLMSWPGFH